MLPEDEPTPVEGMVLEPPPTFVPGRATGDEVGVSASPGVSSAGGGAVGPVAANSQELCCE